MLFPENTLLDTTLIDLAEEVATSLAPRIDPLSCDRWLARSVIQKAVRRAEPDLAIRAVANLFEHDRRSMWRALTIIACEDVGVANIDVLARIVASQQDRKWRQSVGGDWPVVAELVRQMAESNHCQAACDLLLKAINDPAYRPHRDDALDGSIDEMIAGIADRSRSITARGVAVLATGGGLAEGQMHHDPAAVFDTLAELNPFSHVVATCRIAWKISRNPMAMLLPLVWQVWSSAPTGEMSDDLTPPVQLTSGIPGYALDQFTRRGNIVSRALVADNPDMRGMLDAAGIGSDQYATTVGDLIFLLEGTALRRRLVWQGGDELRLPHRWLPAVARLGSHLDQALRLVEAKGSQIAKLRCVHLATLS
ncbi:hypothetical protein [Sphingomonas sp. LT1P40]|uniref:hypothetical protein n=1 Tax=Alteristakelama amylovorans TaxID=3096166 RepID=UPI002FC73EF7